MVICVVWWFCCCIMYHLDLFFTLSKCTSPKESESTIPYPISWCSIKVHPKLAFILPFCNVFSPVTVSVYHQEVDQMVVLRCDNGLYLNISKTREMVVDLHRKRAHVETQWWGYRAGRQFQVTGTTISKNLSWDSNAVSLIKKAQQQLYFQHQHEKVWLQEGHSVWQLLTFSITVW